LQNTLNTAFSLLAFTCLSISSNAQETLFRQVGDTKSGTYVEVVSLFSKPGLGGFLPVRVLIANNQKIPHNIFLDFKGSKDFQDNLTTSSNFSFFVKQGTTTSYDILVPLNAQNGSPHASYRKLKVSLSGTMGQAEQIEDIPFVPEQPVVLLSERLYSANASALDTELKSHLSGSGRSGGGNIFASKFTAKQLPDDWRAFSAFDSIMMTDDDWSEIPAGSRNAIAAWLRLGGQLVIYTQTNVTPTALGLPNEASFGNILTKKITGDRLAPKETIDLAFSNGSKKTRIQAIAKDFNSHWALQDILGKKTFNYTLFVLILIAFGILVGPINLFVFAKSGRRHRLFITTPIISIATSVLLVVLIILQDGFGGAGARIVLMEVRPDENQNAAFIHQEQFSRTGVMTSPSFLIDTSATISPVPIANSRWSRFTDDYNTQGAYDLQATSRSLVASGSWFQSRSEQGQLISAVIPTRGRIETTPSSGELISTFSFPLETILYRDGNGDWFRADKITKGRKMQLMPVEPTIAQSVLNNLTKKFSQRNQTMFKAVQKRDDHFIAFTSQGPAIETHSAIDWQTTTVITGPVAR